MVDGQIDQSDSPRLDDGLFENAQPDMMYRRPKQQMTLRLDADIPDWFKRHAKDGKGYQTDIDKALRAFVLAPPKKGSPESQLRMLAKPRRGGYLLRLK